MGGQESLTLRGCGALGVGILLVDKLGFLGVYLTHVWHFPAAWVVKREESFDLGCSSLPRNEIQWRSVLREWVARTIAGLAGDGTVLSKKND